jgi:hypothetical protein
VVEAAHTPSVTAEGSNGGATPSLPNTYSGIVLIG